MDCRQVNEPLNQYLAGLLSEPQARSLEAHIAQCPSCQALFLVDDDDLETLMTTDWYATEPPVDLLSRVMGGLPTRRSYLWTRVAAILFVWSGYVALWVFGASALWHPDAIEKLYHIALRARASLYFLLSVTSSIKNALSLLVPTPLVVILLLLFLVILSYCVYRLEKEDNLI